MKDYYNTYIKLCLQLSLKDDYADRKNVKKHNAAMDKLMKLEEEMTGFDSSDIMLRLMHHEDDRVRIGASSFCLKQDILTDEAINVLTDVIKTSSDPTLRFDAEMVLKVRK